MDTHTYKLKAAIFISPLLRRVRYNLATPLPPGIYIVFGKREVRGEPFRQYFPHQTATISLQNWGRSAIAIEITENKEVQLFFINAPVSVIKAGVMWQYLPGSSPILLVEPKSCEPSAPLHQWSLRTNYTSVSVNTIQLSPEGEGKSIQLSPEGEVNSGDGYTETRSVEGFIQRYLSSAMNQPWGG